MAINNPKLNATKYSLSGKSIKTGDDRYPSYSSKNVLSKTDSVGERRAPAYELERMNKK